MPDDFSKTELEKIEARTLQLGSELFEEMPRPKTNVLQRRWWDDQLMHWTMRDEAVKVEMFRFVDVLPMLQTSTEVTQHLHEYLGEVRDHLPSALGVAIGVARRTPLVRDAVARAARVGAMDFARKFIAGTTTKEVLEAAQRERELNRGFTLDILGEAVTSDMEAEGYFNAYSELIESIAPEVNAWPEVKLVDQGVTGLLPRMNLSIKLSALDSQFDAIDWHGTTDRVAARLRELLRVAREHGAFINIDMESYDKKDLTLHIFKQVLSEPEFNTVTDVGIVIQCYLRDSEDDLRSLRDWAAARGTPVWVRLVKGAYWDYETTHALAEGWPVPVFRQKWQSDACFEKLTRFTILNYQHLRPALGSHNLRSLAHGVAAAELGEMPDAGLEIQMLYGMGDGEKEALVQRKRRVRVYMPYGELIPGMAYLVRRLLENTSNDSFLRAGFVEGVSPEILLKNPLEQASDHAVEASSDNGHADVTDDSPKEHSPSEVDPASDIPSDSSATGSNTSTSNSCSGRPSAEFTSISNSCSGRPSAEFAQENVKDMTATATAAFANHPPVDFSIEENRSAMQAALDNVRSQLGWHAQLAIGEERVDSDDKLTSFDPSHKDRVVGTVAMASRAEADKAVEAAKTALPAWRATPAAQRADYLRRAAQIMRERLFEIAAWEIYECGKTWREATNDVCEAIDFCEYYALGGEQLESPFGKSVPGEENQFTYLPRGVTAVIAPWNFPLAILCGMATAAMVTGNTVIIKPAEQSPMTASLLMDIFRELQLPPGVLNFLPGRGEIAGAALVEHPDVALIAFTGSQAVGLAINERAAEISASGISLVKRVIAEMGGKNAIIVDADADLDEAVIGVVKSAFGYQGQKCSACSRVIVLESVHDAFLERLIEAARSLKVGAAEDPATTVGPVIDADALAKIREYIEMGRSEGRPVLATDVGPLAEQGYFVGPHIFADIAPTSRLAQEEIFGPILAVIRAHNLDEAIRIANGTNFALTGGIYSRSPAHLDQARAELMVGNLYINRNITGALVGRQPFGGFKMSGIGSKAGGPDYLLQFVVPRTVTENTMRRGFAPPSEE